jgi:hypothetical protein
MLFTYSTRIPIQNGKIISAGSNLEKSAKVMKNPNTEKEKHPDSHIGLLNEGALHAGIKAWYAKPNDRLEALVHGYVIDILRGELIIEIQTGSFSKIRKKLVTLLKKYPVRLVYPIAYEKWIVKRESNGNKQLGRRKSPKRGSYEDLFQEMVSFPSLITHSNFALEVLLIQEEEIRIHDPHRAWRRKGWITKERRLLDVVGQCRFNHPEELSRLIPASITGEFTTSDLAAALKKPTRLAGRMAYCLREMGAIVPVGKRGRAILYTRP